MSLQDKKRLDEDKGSQVEKNRKKMKEEEKG